ncbi:MAG TPA: hypothetical protein VMY37_21570 [Thermoguttaceae bacterium]|nr:hypothetical protein [Thermoguttaceae bacterium]
MSFTRPGILAGLLVAAAFGPAAHGQLTLQTRDLHLAVGSEATLDSLTSLPEGVEYSAVYDAPVLRFSRTAGPIGAVYRGNRSFPASQAILDGDKLTVHYSGIELAVTYRLIRTDDYLALVLESLEGEPIDRVDLLQLRVKKLAHVGRLINVVYDDAFGICLCGGNVATNAEMTDRGDYVVMRATAEKEVGLVGGTAVLFGCKDPAGRFLDVMEVVERDFDLPPGAKSRRLPVQNYSYLWARPTPANVDQYITLARRGGFRMILFSHWAFTKVGPGHFPWSPDYPNGMADLKKVTDAIRSAGLKVGLHIHYNKTTTRDAYVTPVPDDRLHTVRRFTFSAAVDEASQTIPVRENPGGCALADGMRVLKAGKELIAYEGYTTTRPYRFTGCRRGHLGTAASGHQADDAVGLLDVDTWTAFIRYDQNTDLQDETAGRIAEIVRQTGPYDLLYFDGAEDVHPPAWYHVANSQWRVYRLLEPTPPACEAAVSTHFSWHMISRGNAWDVIAGVDGMKDFCDVLPCRSAPAAAEDFTRIEFGWLGRFGTSETSYVGPDVLEYVLSRSAAWGCPFSLSLKSPREVENNPRWEDCFDVMKRWEDARVEGKLSDRQLARLRNVAPEHHQFYPCLVARRVWKQYLDNPTEVQREIVGNRREHHLFVNEEGQHELVEIEEIPNVAGGSVKAYQFRRPARPDDAYLLLWAVTDEAELRLPVSPDRLTAMRPLGKRLPVKQEGGQSVVRVGSRMYLLLPGMKADTARELLGRVK